MKLALLLALHALFYAPVLARLLRRGHRASAPVAHQGRMAMNLHGVAWAAVYSALAHAAWTGQFENAAPIRWVPGALLLLAGASLNIAAVRALRSWRLAPTIDADHQLCTTGPYRWVRHPVYAAVALLGLGTAIWSNTPWAWAAIVATLLAGDARARVEERALVAAFGDRYRDYARRVARLVPGVY